MWRPAWATRQADWRQAAVKAAAAAIGLGAFQICFGHAYKLPDVVKRPKESSIVAGRAARAVTASWRGVGWISGETHTW